MNHRTIKLLLAACAAFLLALVLIPREPDREEPRSLSIACWGDSLTWGTGGQGTSYPEVLKALLEEGGSPAEVVNLGVPGETSREITARAGGLDIRLTRDLAIPAECREVQVYYEASDGGAIALLRHGDGGASQVSIGGVRGTLSLRRGEGTYWFTRSEPGAPVSAAAGSVVVNEGSRLYREHIPIIFMGQNGGWETPAELIEQQQAIVDACGAERFLILGLTGWVPCDQQELEKAMANHWGKNYVNLREALCDEAWISSLGLSCTEGDRAQIAAGTVPDVLRVDAVHFNAQGYAMIGQLVSRQLEKLGYLG